METKQQFSRTELKNAILMILGQNVSLIGSLSFSFALGLYVLNKTGSGTSFALTLMLSTLPRIIFSPLAGILTDKISKKFIVVMADFISGVAVLILLLIPSLPIISIYIVVFIISGINTFLNIAFMSASPNMFSSHSFLKINGLREGIAAISNILAPVLGGVLYATGSIFIIILFNGISFIISAITELFIDFNYNTENPHKENLAGDHTKFRTVIDYILTNHGIMIIFIASLTMNFAVSFGLQVPLTYMMNTTLAFPPHYIGIVEAMFSVGALLGAIYISSRQNKLYPKIVCGSLSMGLIMIGLALPFLFLKITIFYGAVYIGFLFCLLGIILSIINIPIMTKLQQAIPEKIRGKFLSLLTMASAGLIPLALMLSGFLTNYVRPQYLMIISGMLIISLTLALLKKTSFKALFK